MNVQFRIELFIHGLCVVLIQKLVQESSSCDSTLIDAPSGSKLAMCFAMCSFHHENYGSRVMR